MYVNRCPLEAIPLLLPLTYLPLPLSPPISSVLYLYLIPYALYPIPYTLYPIPYTLSMGYGLWAMGYGLWAMGYGRALPTRACMNRALRCQFSSLLSLL